MRRPILIWRRQDNNLPEYMKLQSSEGKAFAMVTGASSGIGLAMARILAAKGYSLALVARRVDRLEGLAEELRAKHGVEVHVLGADLSAVGAAAELYAKAKSLGLKIEVLINNAGVGMQGKFLEMDLERVSAMFRLNVESLTQLTQLIARDMVAQKQGYILQVASMAAFLPSAYVSAYAATKHYVLAFSEALWFELKGSGISVTTLYPGITTTEFNEVADARTPGMMKMSILSAEAVAEVGIRAMFKRKRAVVPGTINKITAFFSRKMPRGMIIRSAGSMMKKANGQ
jgi:short-subunit dehydrogenase